MTERIDLKSLERKAYTSYHQDGLIDIFLGLGIVYFGVSLLFLTLGIPFFIWTSGFFVFFCCYMAAKHSITIPRIGYVEFNPSRRSRIIFLVLFLLVLNLAIFLFMAFGLLTSELTAFLNQYGILVIAVSVGGLFVLFGWVVQLYRLCIYGGVAFVAFALTYVFILHLSLPIIVLGLVIALNGFVLLFKFLRQFPKPEIPDEPEDNWETTKLES